MCSSKHVAFACVLLAGWCLPERALGDGPTAEVNPIPKSDSVSDSGSVSGSDSGSVSGSGSVSDSGSVSGSVSDPDPVADPVPDFTRAHQVVARGEALFNLGSYDAARSEFQLAYRLLTGYPRRYV